MFKVRGKIPKPKLMTPPAMEKFRDMKTLHKFSAVHASIHNHFNRDRHLNRRNIFEMKSRGICSVWNWSSR